MYKRSRRAGVSKPMVCGKRRPGNEPLVLTDEFIDWVALTTLKAADIVHNYDSGTNEGRMALFRYVFDCKVRQVPDNEFRCLLRLLGAFIDFQKENVIIPSADYASPDRGNFTVDYDKFRKKVEDYENELEVMMRIYTDIGSGIKTIAVYTYFKMIIERPDSPKHMGDPKSLANAISTEMVNDIILMAFYDNYNKGVIQYLAENREKAGD